MEEVALTEVERYKVLRTIDHDIALCQAWASYHQTLAVSGIAKRRKISHGTQGPELTDEEKVMDSINTAKTHLHRMSELIDLKKQLVHMNIPEGKRVKLRAL